MSSTLLLSILLSSKQPGVVQNPGILRVPGVQNPFQPSSCRAECQPSSQCSSPTQGFCPGWGEVQTKILKLWIHPKILSIINYLTSQMEGVLSSKPNQNVFRSLLQLLWERLLLCPKDILQACFVTDDSHDLVGGTQCNYVVLTMLPVLGLEVECKCVICSVT